MSTTKGSTTSRFNIVNWLNDVLLLPLTKIQQLGAGNVYCQLLDAAYPEKVPLHKVKWDARTEVDFIHNFKVLQNSFDRLGIEKKIQVQKLIKIKYQDNLQFVQWMRTHLEDKINEKTYEPLKRRNFVKVNLNFAKKKKFNVTLNTSSSQIFNNKENSTPTDNMKASMISNASILTIKSTTNLRKMQPLKTLQERRKTFGPISVLAYKNIEQKKQETFKPLKKSSVFFSNVGIIQSDGEEEEVF